MAKIVEQTLVIKMSQLVKNSQEDEPEETFLSFEEKEALVQAIEGMLDNDSIVVELGE